MGDVIECGSSRRAQQCLLIQSGTSEPRVNLEQVCFQETNRRMRTRMTGGVRGVPGNRAPISIMVLPYASLIYASIVNKRMHFLPTSGGSVLS